MKSGILDPPQTVIHQGVLVTKADLDRLDDELTVLNRAFTPAVVMSGIAAGAIDTWLFLYLAGIPMASFGPTFVVKAIVVLLVGAPAAWTLRRRLA